MMSDVTEPITNGDDLIDSRDVIARIKYLRVADSEVSGDESEELAALDGLAGDACYPASDWRHTPTLLRDGVTLIRDSYFEDYARELAEDIGAVDSEMSWPYSCVDWERAARELQMDYTSVDFDGVTYWIR